MIVKQLYKPDENITVESYFAKCGVKDFQTYIEGCYLEDDKNYDNIDKVKEVTNNFKNLYVLVDCDVDGFMSASMLTIFLEKLGYNVEPLFHSDKLHGLSKEIMDKLLDVEPSLLWIPDAGTNDIEECKTLNELGWDIIVTDHHQKEQENPYCILVNNQCSNNVENKYACGTLTTWHCLHYINSDIANELISYSMIATISDSMLVTSNENAAFLKWGKLSIHENLKPFIDEFNKGVETNRDYSFGVIPAWNSLIRLGTLDNKRELFDALCGKVNTKNIIQICKDLHTKQAEDTKKMVDEFEIDDSKNHIIVKLDKPNALTGLIANKIASVYKKPTFVVSYKRNQWVGSCRSPVDIKDIINETDFASGRGHNQSFGVFIDDIDKFSDYIGSVTLQEPCIEVLKSLSLNSVSDDLYGLFEPYNALWGKGLEQPIFHIEDIRFATSNISILGKNKRTLKIRCNNGTDLLLFQCTNQDKVDFGLGYIENGKFVEDRTGWVFEVECIGSLSVNRRTNKYTNKVTETNQILINRFDIKSKKRPMSLDYVFAKKGTK